MKKLNISDFESSLIKGTGLALLYVKNKNVVLTNTYKETILGACIKNLGYDQQMETDRAYYMYEIIECSNDPEYFLNKIVRAFRNNFIINDWDAYHRFKILNLIAKYNEVSLKPLIYKIFEQNISNSFEFILREDLVEMDGYSAAIFIAETIGAHLLKDNLYYENKDFIKYVENNIEPTFEKNLYKLSMKNRHIRRYLNTSHKNELKKKTFKEKRKLGYREIIERINAKENVHFFLKKWIISEYDLIKIAEELLKEKDTYKLKKYLSIFWYRKFPLSIDLVIKLAKSKNIQLSSSAKQVLSNIKNKNIREYAIDALKNKLRTYEISDNIDLLRKNYKPIDRRLFEKLLCVNYNKEILHSIHSSILSVLAVNKTRNCYNIFKEIYKNLNCLSCRERMIDILIKEKILRGKMLQESLFDANPDIRIKVRRYMRNSANYN